MADGGGAHPDLSPARPAAPAGGERAGVATACPYCGVGCGVIARPDGRGGAEIAGDRDHPANAGRLCAKGSALGETLGLEERLLHPVVDGRRAGWEAALDRVAGAFRDTIERHGPDSVALYVSGQILTEDYYVANKLMKGFVGAANIDTNSRLCMASAVAGHRRAFGTDTVPGTYDDIEAADLVVLVGSNLAWCHPVLFQRLTAARAARRTRVVLVDPRTTATAQIADVHLRPRPGSDVALFGGLLRWLADRGRLDRAWLDAHTGGAEAALAAVAELDLDAVARATGLLRVEIAGFYEAWAATPRTVTLWSQGINQSVQGSDGVNAILNVHLATGRIGREGAGPFSVTGQPNAMGGREVGGLATMLAAHLDIENPDHRARVRAFWGSPRIADRPGLKAVDLFRAVGEGRIKALWIMGTNPAVSLPDADGVREALARCPFVVVSDVTASTDTARMAHVLLPALGWGEKAGTVTNSERVISRQRAFLPPPGEARADWWALAQVGRRMGWPAAFAWESPAQVFAEHAALSSVAGRDFDIGAWAGCTDADYDAMRPFRWPAPAGGGGAARFFADGGFQTPDGRALLIPTPWVAPPAAEGLRLNTGRVRDHWHTMTRTGLSPRLSAHIAEPYAEIHPDDADRLGVGAARLIEVEGPGGRAVLRARVTEDTPRGSIFAPFHWTGETAPASRVNAAVTTGCDPLSGQPGLKGGMVAVRPARVAWFGFAIARARPDLRACAYGAVARIRGGWRAELAGATVPEDWEGFAAALLGEPGAPALTLRDPARGTFRAAFLDADGRLSAAFFAAPEPVAAARGWLAATFEDRERDPAAVLAGRAGAGRPDPGPTVCACFEVGLNTLRAAIADQGLADVDAVGRALSAGSGCGACRPELARLIAMQAEAAS
jgi:assimilatory nitrate reductase catalytic subunit